MSRLAAAQSIALKSGLLTLLLCGVLQAQDSPDTTPTGEDPFPGKRIVRVEEDWVLDVAEADGTNTAPEIAIVFGPASPFTGTHCVFEMNHSTYPDFSPGGMQLQCWWTSWLLGARKHYNESQLLTSVERIRFTCCTALEEDKLIMEIRNGSSLTFGTFGNYGWLKVALYTSRENLNFYDTSNTTEHSRVTFGANRVNRFVRDQVRYYTAEGEVIVNDEDVVVHQLAHANDAEDPINP